jgi:hypothetical protein
MMAEKIAFVIIGFYAGVVCMIAAIMILVRHGWWIGDRNHGNDHQD